MSPAGTAAYDPLDRLGQFAVHLNWESIPIAVRERAQLAFRDTLGTILAGTTTTAARLAARAATSHGGTTPILGTPGFSSAPLAAFALAVSASALDFDDGHYVGGAIHPGSVIVSSLLTAAVQLRATTAELLAAQVVGYEIALRAGYLLRPRTHGDDYHCTGTAATLGAAAAITKLRGGDADQIARSIAIAWAHAPMATFQLPMVKESIGWSAATAYFAADLAEAGFMEAWGQSDPSLLQILPPTPFHRVGAMDDPFVESLGLIFESANTYFKPYAACRYIHTAARSLAELMASHSLGAGDIATLEVHTHRSALFLADQRPVTLDHAQYSFPFVLSAILCCGRAGHEQISEAELANPVRLAEAAKVTVHHDPSLDDLYPNHYATRLVVKTPTRDNFELTRVIAPGDIDDPMSPDELVAKFVALSTHFLGDAAGDVARWLVSPELPELCELLDLLTTLGATR